MGCTQLNKLRVRLYPFPTAIGDQERKKENMIPSDSQLITELQQTLEQASAGKCDGIPDFTWGSLNLSIPDYVVPLAYRTSILAAHADYPLESRDGALTVSCEVGARHMWAKEGWDEDGYASARKEIFGCWWYHCAFCHQTITSGWICQDLFEGLFACDFGICDACHSSVETSLNYLKHALNANVSNMVVTYVREWEFLADSARHSLQACNDCEQQYGHKADLVTRLPRATTLFDWISIARDNEDDVSRKEWWLNCNPRNRLYGFVLQTCGESENNRILCKFDEFQRNFKRITGQSVKNLHKCARKQDNDQDND